MRHPYAAGVVAIAAVLLTGCGHRSGRSFFDSYPDLKARQFVIAKTTLAPGETVQVNVEVQNDGNDTAGTTQVGIYASFDNDISTTDTKVGSQFTTVLPTNATQPLVFNIVAPATPGTYFVAAIADDRFDEQEQSEINNQSNAVMIIVQ